MEPASSNLGVLYLVFIQVVSRLLTFVGNQFLLRYVSPSLLGLAVQLELLSVTILYTSRESLRVALQRQPKTVPSEKQLSASDHGTQTAAATKDMIQQFVNMGHIVLLIGIVNSFFFGYGYLRKSGHEVIEANDFGLSLKLYALATFLELCAEPSFVVIQQTSLYKARARAETVAAIFKCLCACLATVVMSVRQVPMSVLPFAVGQLAYALMLLVMYQTETVPLARTTGFTLLPRKIQSTPGISNSSQYAMGFFSKSLLHLSATFYVQSFFKLLLTQGDSLILSFVADLNAQGAFALASNYGGLLSRLIFQPIEESSRAVFGRLLGAPSVSVSSMKEKENRKVQHEKSSVSSSRSGLNKDVTLQRQAKEATASNTSLALDHLSTTLHMYTLFSLPILALLPHIFPILISALVGSRWSSPATAQLLSAYAYYLPFLAVNGILDAFVTSVASPKELRFQSVLMVFVTIVYGIVAWLLMAGDDGGGGGGGGSGSGCGSGNNIVHRLQQEPQSMSMTKVFLSLSNKSVTLHGLALGPAGLVWANMVNMSLRIVYSLWYIQSWITHNALQSAGPTHGLWRRSLPHIVCIVTAVAVAIGLNFALNLTGVGTAAAAAAAAVEEKRFFGVRGIDATDAGSLVVGALVLGSSM